MKCLMGCEILFVAGSCFFVFSNVSPVLYICFLLRMFYAAVKAA
jgi:hypothetical protein